MLLLEKDRHPDGPMPGLRARKLQVRALQGSAGRSLGSTGGQRGRIPPQARVTLQTARLTSAAGKLGG